jgi:uncharacterized protein (DUF1800 family)
MKAARVASTLGAHARLITMVNSFPAAVAANRFGLGARPGEINSIAADPRGALRAQLHGGAPLIHNETLPGTGTVLSRAADLRAVRREHPRASPEEAGAGSSGTSIRANIAVLPEATQKLTGFFRGVYVDDAVARMHAAVVAERSFVERLVHFWSNHFAVSVDKVAVLGVAGSFEREAIRPHVMGSFQELLLAAEQHPAMLLYLDNYQSVGPNSTLGRYHSRQAGSQTHTVGINENLAREILELHTLGVGGGYTQADVTEFAKVITGWSIGGGEGRLRGGEPGKFYFRDALHEPGARNLLGKRYADAGLEQGAAVLRDCAQSRATAHHVSTKLARHFVADDPPPAAIDRLSKVFLSTDGDLPSLYQALIDLPEAWTLPLSKFKTPSDYIFSSFRALELPVPDGPRALAPFEVLGQRMFSPGSPAGWPDRSVDWDGASSIMKRLEWANQLGQRAGSQINVAQRVPEALGAGATEHTRTEIARAESGAQAVTLLLACPEFMRR